MFERRKVVIAGCSKLYDYRHRVPSTTYSIPFILDVLNFVKRHFCQIHLPPGIRPRVLREEDRSSLRYEWGEGKKGGISVRLCAFYDYTLEYTTVVTYTCSITKRRIFRLRLLSSLRSFFFFKPLSIRMCIIGG